MREVDYFSEPVESHAYGDRWLGGWGYDEKKGIWYH